jgi:hypothetical protein
VKSFYIKIIKIDSMQACYVLPRELEQMVGIQQQLAHGQAAASAGFKEG